MSTPIATVADSIIRFILSLLRDPAALLELQDDPDTTLAKHGVSGVCADDVRAVAPVVIDRPDVQPRNNPPSDPVTPITPSNNPVVREIVQIANNFTMIDNHPTIVDMSTNQTIWANGDVSQVFDQQADVASGAAAIAAGDDVNGASTSATGNTFDDDVSVDTDATNDPAPLAATVDNDNPITDPPAPEAETPVDTAGDILGDSGVPQAAVDAVQNLVDDAQTGGDFTDDAPVPEVPADAPADLAAAVDDAVWTQETDPLYDDGLYDDLGGEQ